MYGLLPEIILLESHSRDLVSYRISCLVKDLNKKVRRILMIWFSVRQETAYVFGSRQVNRDPELNIP
jgi:hypothetical protein